MEVRRRLHFLNRLAHFESGSVRSQWRAEAHCYGIGKLPRHLPEITAAFKAENTSPDVFQAYRDDRRLHAFHDAFKAAAKRKHLADARHLAFREDADDVAGLDRSGCGAKGMDQVAPQLLGGNGDSCNTA